MYANPDAVTLPSLQTPPAPGTRAYSGIAGARRLLWVTFWLVAAAIGIGGSWDGAWHATHPFDGFWSPPHVFVYATCIVASAVVLRMTVSPSIRVVFGSGEGLPFGVPGPLIFLGGGLALAGFAGLALDNFWHSNFGLDETGWSFPHAMLGWAIFITTLGFISCRLALRPWYPARWWTIILIDALILGASAVPIMGPLFGNRTPVTVRAVATIPILAAQPAFQHATRIITTWNLTRENPLLILLAPLWAGVALAFMRRLDRRWWIVLLVVALWAVGDNARGLAETYSKQFPGLLDQRNWRELPILFPAILVLVAPKLRIPERWAYLLAGLLFGVLIYATWDAQSSVFLLVLFAAPIMLLGKRLGELLFSVIEHPTDFARIFPVFALGVAVPGLTGLVDLYLRSVTP